MSEAVAPEAGVKSEDKREIEDEEREKMLNAENKRGSQDLAAASDEPPAPPSCPPPEEDPVPEQDKEKEDGATSGEATETTEKEGDKKEGKLRLPKMNIKMPAFLTRGKSRERAKDGGDGAAGEEGKDLLQSGGSPEHGPTSPTSVEGEGGEKTTKSKLSGMLEKVRLPSNPFKKNKSGDHQAVEMEEQKDAVEGEDKEKEAEANAEGEEKIPQPTPVSRGTRLLEAIRAPLAAVFKPKNKEKDAEAGEGGGEAETGEDKAKEDKGADVEDGLETVKLEPQEAEPDTEKEGELKEGEPTLLDRLKETFAQHRLLICGAAAFLFLVLILIVLAITGSRYPRYTEMLIDGKYINAITSCGQVQGLLDEGEYVFHGVPYAVPPTGERRFAPAEPLNRLDSCWNGTFRAWYNETETGPAQCWQTYRNGSLDGSEDCLTLDIYTRKVRYDAPLPVVMIISSETLAGGRSWRPARGMARQRDVVFVQPRFRLGAFGFLAASAISRTAYPPRSGNYALSDIIAALDWVQINIEHFGGDPESVTIVGHRGGATLVTALTAMSKRRGAYTNRLFKQVWVSSGSGVMPTQTLQQAESHGLELLSASGCDSAACLRRTDPEDILDATPEDWKPRFSTDLPQGLPAADMHHWLIQDGQLIQQDLYNAWADNGLPFKMVVGTTAHVEASPELFSKKDWSQRANFDNHVRGSVLGGQVVPPGLSSEVISRYKPSSWPQLASMISDLRTVCPLYACARRLATIAASSEKSSKHASSVHFYVATQPRNTTSGFVADVGSDIEAILGLYEAQSPEQKRYLSAMQNFFYRFVWHSELPTGASGTEKSGALPHSVVVVGQDVGIKPSYQNCDFWLERELASNYGRVE